MASPASFNHSAFDYESMPKIDLESPPEVLRPYLRSLESFTDEELHLLRWKMAWKAMAREKQFPPDEFENFEKTIWGIRSGRGFGKTLLAANWLGQRACETPMLCAVVSPTHDDVRYTCFEGPTGLLSVIPGKLIADRNSGLPSITLFNGTFIRGFAGDTPERLRGPQHHCAWCDEIASWKYPDEAWDNLWFGLRLGTHPQVVWTGTPKPSPFIRKLTKDPNSVTVVGSTYENRDNLTQTFFDNVAKYEGTKIGRQELYGELLDPEEEGIVKRSQWRVWPCDKPLPKFESVVMSLDTAFTEKTHDKRKQENDPTACSVWGIFNHKHKKNVMLLDCWEEWLGLPDLIARVKRERKLTYGDADEPILRPKGVRKQDRPRHTGKSVDIILIEEKGSGISLKQTLAQEDIFAHGYNPGKADKLARLHITSPMWANGRVWVVESDHGGGKPKTWADPLITQCCSYIGEGSVDHDDYLDTTTQVMKFVMDKFIGSLTKTQVQQDEERREIARMKDQREKRRERGNPYG